MLRDHPECNNTLAAIQGADREVLEDIALMAAIVLPRLERFPIVRELLHAEMEYLECEEDIKLLADLVCPGIALDNEAFIKRN